MGFLDGTGTPNPRGAQFRDPGGFGIIQFANGLRLFFDASEDTGVQYTFQLVGRYGRIIIDELGNSWQIRARAGDLKSEPLTRYNTDMSPVPFTSDEPFEIVNLTAAALKNLISGEAVRCSGDDGMRSLEMVIALHLSHEHGNKKVFFPLPEQDLDKDVKIA